MENNLHRKLRSGGKKGSEYLLNLGHQFGFKLDKPKIEGGNVTSYIKFTLSMKRPAISQEKNKTLTKK